LLKTTRRFVGTNFVVGFSIKSCRLLGTVLC
jgi:hypothetical protein